TKIIERYKYDSIIINSVTKNKETKKRTIYSITKFAVRAITTWLEKKLAHTGVRMTNVSPGMVYTSLTNRADMNRKPLDADDIAELIYDANQKPEHVNVNEITIQPV